MVLSNSIEQCAPLVTKLVRRPPAPWLTDNIKKDMKDRDNILMRLKKDRSNVLIQEEYKIKKKTIKSSIHKSKAQYFQDKFRECGSNTTKKWKIVKDLLPENYSKSNKFQDGAQKSEEFNEFFVNVGQQTFQNSRKN